MANLKPEFKKRRVKLIGLSIDSIEGYRRWCADIEETQGTKPDSPVLGDSDRKIASLFDLIHPNASDTGTVRSVFLIDQKNRISLIFKCPASTGRIFAEHLRAIDPLQLTNRDCVTTPSWGWRTPVQGHTHHNEKRLHVGAVFLNAKIQAPL